MSTVKEAPSYKDAKDTMNKHMAASLPEAISSIFERNAEELSVTYTHPQKLDVGDKAPLFALPNATGEIIKLEDLLEKSKVVLVFYRGTWCPYCNLVLKSYQGILDQIRESGADLVAISPQIPDQSLSIKEKNELDFEVLSDAHNTVSRQYTTIFKIDDESIGAMKQLGADFNSFYSDDSGDIPVPVVYVIKQDGTIAFVGEKGGDFRERVEPVEILSALAK